MTEKQTTGPLGMITFPEWVTGPTPCRQKTSRIILPDFNGNLHGALIVHRTIIPFLGITEHRVMNFLN